MLKAESKDINTSMRIDSTLNNQIDRFIELHRAHIVRDICALVQIKSVKDAACPDAPFGQGIKDALDKALEISRELGFETDNCNNYCASASLKHNYTGPYIAFWGHLDVVPEGEGWVYSPYEPALCDGHIVGRGVIDDKGPAICALYALLFFAEHQYSLKYNYKVIFGTDEETAMEDVQYFKEHRPLPVFSIISDSGFPVCYAEKGIFHAEVEIPLVSDAIIHFSGGSVRNAVPAHARIQLKKSQIVNYRELPTEISLEDNESSVILSAEGKGAHAGHPEGSRNAIHILASFLAEAIRSENLQACFKLIAEISGSYDGSNFNIKCSDDVSGKLTCVAGVLKYEENKITISLDIRYPVKINSAELVKKIRSFCNARGAALVNLSENKPYYVPPDSEIVLLFNSLYNDVMNSDVPPYYSGGGSYARKVPNALAFGPVLHTPAIKPEVIAHGGPHKADESLNIDDILLALKIYILSIFQLDKLDFTDNVLMT